MKILTGTLRGQTILFKANRQLRPTTDKTRKAIFDILGGAVENTRVLDLYSGTGALGFEALSQGAAHVTFVEHDPSSCQKIRENLRRFKFEGSVELCQADVLDWVRRHDGKTRVAPFDLILFDPPYQTGLAVETLLAVSQSGLLSGRGFLVLECRRKEDAPQETPLLHAIRQKRYGQTKVLIYAAKPGSAPIVD